MNVEWTFDPMESEKNLYYFDDNGDGKLSSSEVETLYNEGFKRIKDFGYFIFIKTGNKQLPINKIKNFNAVVNDNKQLVYSFSVSIPDIENEILTVSHFDTSYFVSFSNPVIENVIVDKGLYKQVRKNTTTPYYYDPYAGVGVVLDTSKPKPGWEKVYPTEILISNSPIKTDRNFNFLVIKDKFISVQKAIYYKLSDYLIDLNSGLSIELIILLLLSLLYGIIHALGPGHRKVVISSYLLSKNNSNLKEGIILSQLSALIHSATGIFSVLILYYLFNTIADGSQLSNSAIMNNFSSLILLILVILLIVRKIKPAKTDCCAKDNRSEKSLIILSSFIPCPGSATIMLVAISMDMLYVGVLSVIFMSVGIGTTLSILAILSLKGKAIINSFKSYDIIKLTIEWLAIAVLLLFSITLFNIQG